MFNRKSFAIRISNLAPTPNKTALYSIFKKASEELPNFTVEGINKSYKKNPCIVKETIAKADLGTHEIEAGILKKVPRNLVCMGVSKRADVTFEAEDTIRLSAFVTLVPIYDIEEHFKIILDRIAGYLLAAYGWKPLEAAKKAKAKKEKKAKKAKKNVISNLRSLFGNAEETRVRRNVVVHAY